jgi:hypothetical protein
MKKIISIFCLCFFLGSISTAQAIPKGLKKADLAEYGKYLAWCRTNIQVCALQHGVLTVVAVNGQWTDSLGHYTEKVPRTVKWYRVTYKGPFIAEPNQIHITRVVLVNRPYRSPTSVSDFYNWWVKYPGLHE